MITRASVRVGVMGGVWCERRGLSTGQVTLSRYAVRRMLVQDGNKRVKRQMNFDLPRVHEAATVVAEGGNKIPKIPKHSSRLQNLNKVYLDKITDILSTGELATHFYGRNLEISQVCVHPNLQGINVYWMTSGTHEQDQETEEILKVYSKTIRHELSSLRVIGHSPPITFLRDDRHHKLQEVERLLATADYGDDFEHTNPGHHLKAVPPTLAMSLDTKLKTAIEGLEGEHGQEVKEDPQDHFEVAMRIATSQPLQEEGVNDAAFVLPPDLPTMRGDVLGVNTTKIYSLIHQSMKRAKAEHRRLVQNDSESNPLDHYSQKSLSPVNTNRKQEIQKWASQYKQLQNKETRKKNKQNALLRHPGDFPTEEFEEQEIEVNWVEEDDYIDELQ